MGRLFIVSVFSFCLFACSQHPAQPTPSLLTPLADSSLDRPCQHIRGTDYFRHGQQVKLVLAADDFFYADSPRLLPQAQEQIAHIQICLAQFPKVHVDVTGYTDNQDTGQCQLALSTTRAQIIADKLWQSAAAARLLTVAGAGSSNPVARNVSAWGRAQNRRVEIAWRVAS